jgi:HD-like signal output (HDOD) protein
MLSSATIDSYIDTIPPIPAIVKRCVDTLNSGNLVLAADIANEDRALKHYLQSIVNKPIFGFVDEIKDARQIFGVLGLVKAKQLMYSYYILLILPKKWEVFDFSTSKFQNFQAHLIVGWGKIMQSLKQSDEDLIQAVSIVPASIIVCEMLFVDLKDTVELLRENKQMSYDVILLKMTERNLFEIASLIAKKWDFSQKTIDLILKIGDNKESDENSLPLSYLQLLIMYEMSKPAIIESGLNDLFDFNMSFNDETTENFLKIMKSDKKT